jgi:hypothetical protein
MEATALTDFNRYKRNAYHTPVILEKAFGDMSVLQLRAGHVPSSEFASVPRKEFSGDVLYPSKYR